MPYRAYSGPIFLYHHELPPLVVYGEKNKREALDMGYTTEYLPASEIAYSGPIFLYHHELPPLVVYGEKNKREALDMGYTTEYLPASEIAATITNQESD